jgi:hypothetical protein
MRILNYPDFRSVILHPGKSGADEAFLKTTRLLLGNRDIAASKSYNPTCKSIHRWGRSRYGKYL